MLGHNRPAYLAKIMQLPLLNPSSICFVNATVQAWLWATLCCVCPLNYLWGDKMGSILQWVTDLDCIIPQCILDQDWFRGMRNLWGDFRGQQDAAEFVQQFLRWVDGPALRCTWEKRVLLHGQNPANPEDKTGQPIILQLPPPLSQPRPTLQSLIKAKSEVDGMRSALTTIPSILMLQIDRRYKDERGNLG